jgi:hypothetical protein
MTLGVNRRQAGRLVMTREDYRLARIDELARRPVSAISEAALLEGYRFTQARVTLETVCACGGLLRSRDDRAAIAACVEAHNASQQHERWRGVR